MSKITYDIIEHRREYFILIKFSFNPQWNQRIKKVEGATWSKTHHGWLIPDTIENRNKCRLGMENTNTKNLIQVEKSSPAKKAISTKAIKSNDKHYSLNNEEQMRLYMQQLILKGYSISTMRTYQNEFSQMLSLLKNIDVQSLQPRDLQRYLLHCIKIGLKENTLHSRINALKFYFEKVLHRDKFFFEIPRRRSLCNYQNF